MLGILFTTKTTLKKIPKIIVFICAGQNEFLPPEVTGGDVTSPRLAKINIYTYPYKLLGILFATKTTLKKLPVIIDFICAGQNEFLPSEVTGGGVTSPRLAALAVQQCFRTFSVFCQGLLAGLSGGHCLTVSNFRR